MLSAPALKRLNAIDKHAMKSAIFFFIILLIIAPIALVHNINKKEQIGIVKTYSIDADYALGVVLYESEKYNSNYEQDRINAIKRLKKSAAKGLAPAQFYLGKIYHSDPLLSKKSEGISLIKKAAYQNDEEAIQFLIDKKIAYKAKPEVNKYKKYLLPLFIIHLLISATITFWVYKKGKIQENKNKIVLIWLLPYTGGILGLMGFSKK